jgi:lysyl-tRNA synthetase class 2
VSGLLLANVFNSIGDAYETGIADRGKEPALFMLLAFLLSFGFIRTSAHMIRAEVSWWPGNVEIGGTHIHHLVWGILLLLVTGYVGFAFNDLEPPLRDIFAILFGVGMGLTLDEFALWLNLEDVYWSEQGRRSIDAVIVAGVLGLILLLGLHSFVVVGKDVAEEIRVFFGFVGLLGIIVALVNVAKGKYGWALATVLFPVAGVPPALRLAKPGSLWARGYGDRRAARSRERFAG